MAPEMFRRFRLGALQKIIRHRCGYVLPEDDAGHEYIVELLLSISLGPRPRQMMAAAIKLWAPWIPETEAEQRIAHILSLPVNERMPSAKVLGDRIRLTNWERDLFQAWTIRPFDLTAEELAEQRKRKARERDRKRRASRGAKGRAEYEANSLSRTEPWKAEGVSKATWYRHQKHRETSPCQVRVCSTAQAPVSRLSRRRRRATRAPPEGGASAAGTLALWACV